MHAGKQVGGVDKGGPGGAPCCCGYISRAADAQSADADATFWQLEEDNKKLKGHVKQLTDENEVIRAELQQNKSNIEERSGKERAPTDKDREASGGAGPPFARVPGACVREGCVCAAVRGSALYALGAAAAARCGVPADAAGGACAEAEPARHWHHPG